MAGDTDLDLAMAIALAEASEGVSDDDFKPSRRRVDINQRLLFQNFRDLPKKKPATKRAKKKQRTHGDQSASVNNFENRNEQDENASRRARELKKTKKNTANGSVIFKRGDILTGGVCEGSRLSAPKKAGSQTCPLASSERKPIGDFAGNGNHHVCQELEGTGYQEPQTSSEQSTPKERSSVLKAEEECSNPENSTPGAGVTLPNGQYDRPSHTALDEMEDDFFVVDIGSEEVMDVGRHEIAGVANETQFSILLRLCDEDGVEELHDAGVMEHPNIAGDMTHDPPGLETSVCLSPINSMVDFGDVPRGNAVSKSPVPTGFCAVLEEAAQLTEKASGHESDVHGSESAVIEPVASSPNAESHLIEDWSDDISSMMTQQCVPQLEQVESLPQEIRKPLQDIPNPLVQCEDVKFRSMMTTVHNRHFSCGDADDDVTQENGKEPTIGPVILAHKISDDRENHKEGENDSENSSCGGRPQPNIAGGATCRQLQPGSEKYPRVDSNNREDGVTDQRPEIMLDNLEVDTAVLCPVCGDNISELAVELRESHSNICLDKLDKLQECTKDQKSEEYTTLPGRDASMSDGCDKVKKWLETLDLSRYVDMFMQHEIDWDTLQWLKEEDLLLLGVTALGPRRKIFVALQELKNGGSGRTEFMSRHASGMEDDTRRTAEISGRVVPGMEANNSKILRMNGDDSHNLITKFFPVAPESGMNERPMTTNIVRENRGGKRPGSHLNPRQPRSFIRPNVRGIPAWMCIPGTPFRVDAFQHLSGDCSHWFLTHFHTDHYQGLTRGFRYGQIYCSSITARLVNLRIGVSWDRLVIVPLNEKYKICGVDVTFIDANHCPGSVMILFEPPDGEKVLHTGDFRFCSAIGNSDVLQAADIHTLILDTTYCDQQYDFPTQESVIQFVIEAIQAEAFNRETLFLIGTYTIGKERIFLEVGKVLQKMVYVGAAKKKLLDCLDLSAEDTQWLTCDDRESYIHVVPLWSISSFKRMNSISRHYRGTYKLIVAFSPTGWSFGRGKKKASGRRCQQGTMIRYDVPYSEHSSYPELKEFVKFISPVDIIPSVPGKSGVGPDEMIANLWSEDS